METIPKKYDLTSELNHYGNLDYHPKGWVTLEDSNINTKSKFARQALSKPYIHVYEVRVDWIKRRGRFKPVFDTIIHMDQVPRVKRLIEAAKAKAKEQSKKQARKRAIERKKGIPSKLELRRIEEAKQHEAMVHKCREYGVPEDEYGEMLIDNLKDVTEAHPDWLYDAHMALSYSIENKGIMWSWYHYWRAEEDCFYECLCKAINAYRRHNYTDYDAIDKQGMSDDEVDFLREQYTEQGIINSRYME